MKRYIAICSVLLATGLAGKVSGQTNTAAGMIQYIISKIKTIENNYRLVEKTFSDYFYDTTGINENRTFVYRLYSNNRYTFTAFAPGDLVADINVQIIQDRGDKGFVVITTDKIRSNNIQFSFTPTESGDYFIAVSCRFASADALSSRFGLIIDREL